MSKTMEDVVEEYKGLVLNLTNKSFIPTYMSYIDKDDIYQEGMIGLIDAYTRYDDSYNKSFLNYAYIRVSGAIKDAIRKYSPIGRHVFEKSIKSSNNTWYKRIQILEDIVDDKDLMHGVILVCTDDLPIDIVEREDMYNHFFTYVSRLKTRDNTIFHLWFNKRMSMKKIGSIFDVTESRISQIIGEIFDKFKPDVGMSNN